MYILLLVVRSEFQALFHNMEGDVAESTLSIMTTAFKQFLNDNKPVSAEVAAKFMHVFDPWLTQVVYVAMFHICQW